MSKTKPTAACKMECQSPSRGWLNSDGLTKILQLDSFTVYGVTLSAGV